MGLVFGSADVILDHTHHYRVEIANPSQFERGVRHISPSDLLLESVDHTGLDTLTVELGSNTEDDSEDTVGLMGETKHQPKAEFIDKAELTVETADDAVQVGNHHEEADGLVVEEGEVDETLVDNGTKGAHQFLSRIALDGFDPGVARPSLIIDEAEVVGNLLEVAKTDMLEAVTGRILEPANAVVNGLRQDTGGELTVISKLVEVVLPTVILEKLDVVRRVVRVGVERSELEPVGEQTPPSVARTEVNGAVHSLHTFGSQPVAGGVEKKVGERLVVLGLEEPYPTGRLRLKDGILGIIESSDTTDNLTGRVASNPTASLTRGEFCVTGRVENTLDVRVERADPITVTTVEPARQIQK